LIFVAAYGLMALSGMHAELALLTNDRIVKVDKVQTMQQNVDVIAQSVRNIALLTDAARKQSELAAILKAREANAGIVKTLEASITSERGLALLKAAAEARGPYNTLVDRAVEFGKAKMADDATDLVIGKLLEAQTTYVTRLQELTGYQKELMAAAGEQVDETVTMAEWLLVEESAAASDSLRQEAAQLAQAVAFFQVEGQPA
jgi:methyl-accepting chemotaxis protein